MNTQYLDYTDGEITCEAYVAYDESQTSKRPCVLVSHQWSGQSDAERKKAEQLAQLGYVGFAIDIYGKGVRGGLLDDNSKLIQPFLDDRAMLRRRILAALAAAQRHPMVAPDRIGAIGYCFGGLCVLDLARSAAPGVKGVVSFHGGISSSESRRASRPSPPRSSSCMAMTTPWRHLSMCRRSRGSSPRPKPTGSYMPTVTRRTPSQPQG